MLSDLERTSRSQITTSPFVGFLVSVSLCLCGASVAAVIRRPVDPNVITLAVFASPNDFDPRVGTDEVSQKVYQLVYDNLLNLDDAAARRAGAGDAWEQPDDLTYVVASAAGREVPRRARADVGRRGAHVQQPDRSRVRLGAAGAYALLDRVEAVDPYTARFVLKEPSGSFLIQLVLPIVPAGAGPELRAQPVGTGPYRFVGYAVDDRLELAAFPDYHGGAPRNAGLVLKIVPDEIMRGLELRKGTVDLVVNDLTPDTVEQLREEDGDADRDVARHRLRVCRLNLRDQVLADRRVRQAIGYAIDREAIVKYLRRGLAQPAVGVVPPSSWAFEADAFQFAHDPAQRGRCSTRPDFPTPTATGRAAAAADAEGLDQRVLPAAGRGDSAGPARRSGSSSTCAATSSRRSQRTSLAATSSS